MFSTLHEDILYSSRIDIRIAELTAAHDFPNCLTDYENAAFESPCFEEEHTEYAELERFKHDCITRWGQGAWERGLSFVAESYWDTYADGCAEDLFGTEVTRQACWHDDEWSTELQEPFSKIIFDDTEYWSDGTR